MEMNATNLLPYNANPPNPSLAVPSSSGTNWWLAPGQKAAEEAEAFRAAAAGQPTNEQMQKRTMSKLCISWPQLLKQCFHKSRAFPVTFWRRLICHNKIIA
ncbi:hypothetical protein niasHS_015244 [Heterodera schachtii]|uniref:Uncharacterized protein n=2 Tax=Heterodera TaxID=34509 RepID=A0ABD2I1M4_HETSC